MLHHVPEPGEAPRRSLVLSGEESHDDVSSGHVVVVEESQRQEEVRNGHSDETDRREDVVTDGVLMSRRIRPDGYGHEVAEYQRGKRDGHAHGEPVGDQALH